MSAFHVPAKRQRPLSSPKSDPRPVQGRRALVVACRVSFMKPRWTAAGRVFMSSSVKPQFSQMIWRVSAKFSV
jgi:hypothetical protein